jgi:hypothetical protein
VSNAVVDSVPIGRGALAQDTGCGGSMTTVASGETTLLPTPAVTSTTDRTGSGGLGRFRSWSGLRVGWDEGCWALSGLRLVRDYGNRAVRGEEAALGGVISVIAGLA